MTHTQRGRVALKLTAQYRAQGLWVDRAGPGCLDRIPRRSSGLLPGLVLCNFARWA